MTDDTGAQVRYDEEAGGYLLTVEGQRAGVAEVERRGDVMAFTHTEIDPDFGGRGLGTVLVSRALADVAEEGLAVEPECTFVAGYLERHPEAARRA
ncbi:GNAT family N-acetyltransferase [Isoptericola sp. b441]|uniref:GNAT family N-acetyltransferase n=1 Tax=Actinotalea lenta TaxID=3064654 RepID=A0ABT9D617_9CELL|nr:GNAT family N-acetyltransferase [Isoptericola sp. b441]MDO8106262.1 GNAT family N-acetyltransferase [Isoptericola sp. b441]